MDQLPVLGSLGRLERLLAEREVNAAVVGSANRRALDLRSRLFNQAAGQGRAWWIAAELLPIPVCPALADRDLNERLARLTAAFGAAGRSGAWS